MKRIMLACLIVAACFALLPAIRPALADNDTYISKTSGPCKDDVRRYCPDVRPGAGRIWSCLKGHESQLAPACRAFRVEQREKMRSFHAACKNDVRQFCGGIPAGKGKIVACLKEHRNELMPSCSSFFEKN